MEPISENEECTQSRIDIICLLKMKIVLKSSKDGGGNGITKTSLITHLRDRHCNGDAQVITRQSLSTNLAVFEEAEVTFKRMGIWLCGSCFKTHSLRSKCRHGKGYDFVSPPDCGEGVVRFVLYDLTKPHVPSSSEQLDHVDDLVHVQHEGFTLALLDSLFLKRLRTVKSVLPKCRLRFSRVLKEGLDKVICTPDDISCWVSLLVLPLCLLKTFCPRSNLEYKSTIKRQRQEESIVNAIRSWSLPGDSLQLMRETLVESSPPFSDVDEEDIDLVLSSSSVSPYNDATLEDLKTKNPFKPPPSLPYIYIDHHHLVPSPTVVLDIIKIFPHGTSCGRYGLHAQHLMDCLSGAAVAIFDELVSSITQVVNLFFDGKCPIVLGKYIASAPLTPLVKPGGGILPIVVGTVWRRLVSKVSVVMISNSMCGYLDDLQFGVRVSGGGEAILHTMNRLIEDRGDDVGLLMLLVDFKNAFNLVDREFGVRVVGESETILHFVNRLIEAFGGDVGLSMYVERIVTASGPRFGDWQWRLSTLPFAFGGLGVYSAGDVLNYAFHASRFQTASLQTKLLRHSGIVASGNTFHDALCVFNTKMETDILSNPSEIAASKLMKKLADIYFTHVTQTAKSTFSLSPRQMALWKSQMEDHTFDWLRVVPISGLGQTMNGKTYRYVMCYRLGIPLFSVSKPCSACSRVFVGDIYGDHAVSCVGIIGIKHRHNVIRDTLVDICYRSGISAGKEVDIGLVGWRDKPLRPANMLVYSWDGGLDVCVDLTGSLLLTQTWMVDFVPGRVVIDAAQRKRGKYMAKCADIRYGFLSFSFYSLGELEADTVILLKRIRKFSMAQDIGARAAVHIFNRVSFAIAKGVGSQIVPRLPSNLL
ncbi:hypothetical protein Tco_0315737 [Tanacetum coccineum]